MQHPAAIVDNQTKIQFILISFCIYIIVVTFPFIY